MATTSATPQSEVCCIVPTGAALASLAAGCAYVIIGKACYDLWQHFVSGYHLWSVTCVGGTCVGDFGSPSPQMCIVATAAIYFTAHLMLCVLRVVKLTTAPLSGALGSGPVAAVLLLCVHFRAMQVAAARAPYSAPDPSEGWSAAVLVLGLLARALPGMAAGAAGACSAAAASVTAAAPVCSVAQAPLAATSGAEAQRDGDRTAGGGGVGAACCGLLHGVLQLFGALLVFVGAMLVVAGCERPLGWSDAFETLEATVAALFQARGVA